MSDGQNQGENQQADTGQQIAGVSELEMLKSRARMMGIEFSNNIGLETLKAKVQAKLDGTKESVLPDVLEEQAPQLLEQANALEVGERQSQGEDPVEAAAPKKPETLRERLVRENMYLVRCRITNLDPKKKDLPGEVITVANEVLGTVRKFIPYGEATEDGYHIPKILYEMLRTRKFLNIRTIRDRRTGTERVSQNWSPEFSIEVLEPLTREELTNLAQAQIAAGSVEMQNAA